MLKNLLLLTGFSTFVVIVIVGLDIYHNFTLSSLPASTQRHIVPISPTFDKKVINGLKERKSVTVNLDEKSTVISEDSKTTANLSPTPSVISPQQVSTSSGELLPQQ